MQRIGAVEEYLTVLAAAKYLEISRDKVSRLIRSDSLKAITNPLDNRQRLIPRKELDKLRFKGRIVDESEVDTLTNLPSRSTGKQVKKVGDLMDVQELPIQ